MEQKISKYWSEMFISNENNNESSYIISTEPPIKYDGNNIIISHNIKESEYDEVVQFCRDHNKMSTGNTTLLSRSSLEKYLSFDNISIIIRSQNGKLIGVILSIIFPIKVGNTNKNGDEIIKHGCTTFLNVHSSVRNHGLCMALIRELTMEGYKRQIYCDYHTIPFQLGTNSIKLYSYYRPINLKRCTEIGFVYPDCYDMRKNTANRIKYSNKLIPGFEFKKANENSLEFYLETIENKKFAYYPDKEQWNHFIKCFLTYEIFNNGKKVGIVSINTISCLINTIKQEAKVAMPIIISGNISTILKTLPYILKDNYDVLYLYDIFGLALKELNYIKTDNEIWFSLYNNRINLNASDLSVPFL